MSTVNWQPLTPVSFLERSARVFPDRVAVIDGATRLTYGDFHDRARALGGALLGLGVNSGDRVAVLAVNGEALLVAHYGIPMIGAVLVAINTRLAQPEIEHILNHSGAKVLVVDPSLLPNLAHVKGECPDLRTIVSLSGFAPDSNADSSYESLIAEGMHRPAERSLEDERQMIAVNYTSGSTGQPKGVMCSHRGAFLNAMGDVAEMELTSATRYLWTLPMFHCNGWCYTWAVTAVSGVHVCLPRPVPADVFRLVQSESITHLCAAPTVLIDLAQYATSAHVKLQTPLRIMTGGAPPSPQIIRNMELIGAEVIHLYGLTETYGPSVYCQWRPEWDTLPFSEKAVLKARQGVADLMVELRVVREDMIDVAADGAEVGELVIRGNAVMEGYLNDPEATEKAFRGGWFHSGDLAVMHPDGYIEMKDRQKDIIISGGENISTLEVERVIYTHPGVLEVAVVASPHERWGEVPKAFVVLKPGATVSGDEILAHCRGHLAGFKCPRRFEFVDELPKTSTGKVQKRVLRDRERAAAQVEGSVS